MADIFISGGGSGAWSSDVTATRANILANGHTAVTNDSDEIAVTGTLALSNVKPSAGGTLGINTITNFGASQSNTAKATVNFTWTITAQTGRPWGGIYIRCKKGSYPSSRADGTECGYYSGTTGGTYAFSTEEDDATWYFRAWDFYRYNERGDSSYDSTTWGTNHDANCRVVRHPSTFLVTYAGQWDANKSGSFTIPQGYNHIKVCVVACGGWSGASYTYYRNYSSSSGSSWSDENIGDSQAGGEGGEVKILDIDCTPGTTASYYIGCAGRRPDGVWHDSETSTTYTSYLSGPWTQGTPGGDTTFTYNGTTYRCLAGNCGQCADNSSYKQGGTGRAGADGGNGKSGHNHYGENGGNGTYFSPTGVYYGGGGSSDGYWRTYYSQSSEVSEDSYPGTPGATAGAYGHGGNGIAGGAADAGEPGAVIIQFS